VHKAAKRKEDKAAGGRRARALEKEWPQVEGARFRVARERCLRTAGLIA
jgi:hypothetical protein